MPDRYAVRVMWQNGYVTYTPFDTDLDAALAGYRATCNLVGSPYMPEHKVASVAVSRMDADFAVESFPFITGYNYDMPNQ